MTKIIRKISQGFTLIELIVVVTIIGILATLIAINYSGSQAKARDAKRKSDLSDYSSAIESYFDDNNYYPKAKSSLGGGIGKGALTLLLSTYVQNLIEDPLVKKFEYGLDEQDPYTVTVKRNGIKAKVLCRYGYWGGSESRVHPATGYTPSIFEYTLSSCIENPNNTLPEIDARKNPWRYEIGHVGLQGIDKLYLCGHYGTYSGTEDSTWDNNPGWDCGNI